MRQSMQMGLVLLLLTGNTVVAEEFIEHKKHVHGKAELNIAIEGADVEMLFDSPAMNILGFEHKPSTEHDKQTLTSAIKVLRDGKMLFGFDDCELKDSEVATKLLETHHDKHDDHHGNDNHSDFSVHYHFKCLNRVPAKVDTGVFVRFPGLEKLTVTVLGSKQSQKTLTQSDTTINLL